MTDLEWLKKWVEPSALEAITHTILLQKQGKISSWDRRIFSVEGFPTDLTECACGVNFLSESPFSPHSRFSHWCSKCRIVVAAREARKEQRGALELQTAPERAVKRALVRAMKAGVPATLTVAQWQEVYVRHSGKCAYCKTANAALIEHQTPVCVGGGTTAENCVPSCHYCNERKGGLYAPLGYFVST